MMFSLQIYSTTRFKPRQIQPKKSSVKPVIQNPNPFQKQNQLKIQISDLKASQEIRKDFSKLVMKLNLNSIAGYGLKIEQNWNSKIQIKTNAIQTSGFG